MENRAINLTRRGFLVSLGLGGAGAVVGTVAGKALLDKASVEPPNPGAGRGYQLSEHVLKYYRTTRV